MMASLFMDAISWYHKLHMRSQVLSNLHDSHQWTIHTKQHAHLTMYWSGIDNDIENMVLSCKNCQDHVPSNPKHPIVSKCSASHLFYEIVIDFCSYGSQTYLITVDYFTDWPVIIYMGHNTTVSHLIQVLRQSFCHTAIPDVSPRFSLMVRISWEKLYIKAFTCLSGGLVDRPDNLTCEFYWVLHAAKSDPRSTWRSSLGRSRSWKV